MTDRREHVNETANTLLSMEPALHGLSRAIGVVVEFDFPPPPEGVEVTKDDMELQTLYLDFTRLALGVARTLGAFRHAQNQYVAEAKSLSPDPTANTEENDK